MPLPPKRPGAGRPQQGKAGAKPPTRRAAPPPATGRAGVPAAPPKNNLPMILGICGGVAAVLIILFVALSGGDEPKADKIGKTKEPKAESAKKAPPPDVSALEATGKSKCEDGMKTIQPRLNPDPSAPKDRVFNDLEAGL